MKNKIISFIIPVLMIAVPFSHVSAADAKTTPQVSAKGAVLIEAQTGNIVMSKNADTKLPMASTTKIMTTLLCLESGDLDEEFVVDPEAIKVEGSSMGLMEGDIVSKRDLCIGMLLPSGNDAANATAVKVAGSIEEFAKLMNKRAQEIGMTRTYFVTPSGLEGEGHGASAYDMSLLAREALRNKDFAKICSKPSARLTFGNPPYDRWLKNTNKLLSMYGGVTGVKTGFTDEAGRCLVSSCERNGVSLICVTLNDRNDWDDHMKMYDYGFSVLHASELSPEKLSVNVAGGAASSIPVKSDGSISVGTPDSDLSMIESKVFMEPFLYAPVESGTYAGYVEYYFNDRLVGSLDLYTSASTGIETGEVKKEPTVFKKVKEFSEEYLNEVRNMRVVTTQQMRKLETLADKSGITYKKLMDNAGACLAQKIEFCAQQTIANPDIVFLCGSGNNAGDCFTAASLLRQSSYNIYVCLMCGEPKTQISLEAYKNLKDVRIIDNYEGAMQIIDKAEIIVDGLFGTGFHGELSPQLRAVLNKNQEAVKIAVDIPSGGNGNTGSACYGCFCADYTVTFGYKKFGMTQYPLKNYCGKIEVCDIGIPEFCLGMLDEDLQEIDDSIISGIIKPRNPDSHKGTYGTVLCLTGSASMPGAGILSSRAALRCGAGLVKVCAVKEDIPSLASVMPEAVYISMKSDNEGFYTFDNMEKLKSHLSKAQAVLIGCGLGVTDETKKLVREIILTSDCPVVLDADGINCIADCIDIISKAKSKIILTPHPKEMAGLLKCSAAQVQSDRLDKCRSFISTNKNAVLVLKGAGTIIMDSKKVYINNTGNPGMSCGGSGDVLSGMIASFAALKTDPLMCAVLGVNLHGRAGDAAAMRYSMSYMQPSDIISCLPDIFLKLEKAVNVKGSK